MSSSSSESYVRVAEPHEYEEVGWVLARAFARDPAMSWYGGVKEAFPEHSDIQNYNALPAAAKRTFNNLHTFQLALVRAVILSGGFITVAVIPSNGEGGKQSSSAGKGEKIAGATLWLKPGQTMDFPIMTIIRSGVWRVLLAFGFTGVKRVLFDFSPAVEHSLEKSFKAHGLDRRDSWHLLEMVVDPPHQGKGFCSIMMKDGFERTYPKPVHLEATTPKTLAIYSKYGFEIDEQHQFGKGAVDVNGLAAKGEKATGYPEWVMTKWSYPERPAASESQN